MSSRRADLYPPLGVKGGPCKVVDRILSNVQNVRDQEALIRDVENNRDLTNAQAAIIYPKPDRERGAPPSPRCTSRHTLSTGWTFEGSPSLRCRSP